MARVGRVSHRFERSCRGGRREVGIVSRGRERRSADARGHLGGLAHEWHPWSNIGEHVVTTHELHGEEPLLAAPVQLPEAHEVRMVDASERTELVLETVER